MLKIGITGGIGSGKTTVAEVFEKLGVPVFYADSEAKASYVENEEVKESVKSIFGNDVYLDNGKPDRKKIASKIFSNKELLEKINAIIHPAVAERFEKFCQENHHKAYVLKEAAILFESNAHKNLDYTICVDAPENIRIQRIIKRDNSTKNDVRMRMKNQWPASKKAEMADFIIVNDGKSMILPQIILLHEQFNNK